MDQLRRFNGDIHTREAVQQFLADFIAEEGVRLMFQREDVSHIADAKDLIDKAFIYLETEYGVQDKPKEKGNQAQ